MFETSPGRADGDYASTDECSGQRQGRVKPKRAAGDGRRRGAGWRDAGFRFFKNDFEMIFFNPLWNKSRNVYLLIKPIQRFK